MVSELADLLIRAAAAIETLRGGYPGDLTPKEYDELIEDPRVEADNLKAL
jgi:hypothetical protein